MLKETPPGYLMSELRPESPLLIWLNQRFPLACRDVKIISCFETEETRSLEFKDPCHPALGFTPTDRTLFHVPRMSACLDWPDTSETRIPIHADHSQMAKLSDSFGSAYHEIEKEIAAIVQKAPSLTAKRWEEFKAPQAILDVFISLQYETSWLRSWEDAATAALGSPDQVPYGHPAYPFIAEADWVLESLGRILQRHTVDMAATDPSAPLEASSASPPTRISLRGLPWVFPMQALTGMAGVGLPSTTPSKTTFDLMGWGAEDRTNFSLLVDRLHRVNENLASFSSELPASWDITACSAVFRDVELNAGGMLGLADAASHQQPRHHSFLDKRASFIRQYAAPTVSKPELYTANSIARREGSELSNFRLLTPLKLKHPAEAGGKQNQQYIRVMSVC